MNTKYSSIKGYPGYYISKRGTLFTSLKRVGVKGKGHGRKGTTTVISNTWRKRLVSLTSNGYLQCTLFRKRFYIHRLVYEAWIGNIPNGYDIDHKEKGLSIKKISLKYGYSRYFIHQVLKGIR